jgi:hypothetical protein
MNQSCQAPGRIGFTVSHGGSSGDWAVQDANYIV